MLAPSGSKILKFAFALLLLVGAGTAALRAGDAPAEVPEEIRALLAGQKFAEAEKLLLNSLTRSPEWERGYLLLGQIYARTGRYEQAESSTRAAVRRRESLDAFMLLATTCMKQRKLNESIAWLEKAAARRPDFPEIYKLLGLDYALGLNPVESEKAFRRATELGPTDWELHYVHGRSLFELRRFDESERALRKAVELNRQSTKAWTALGQTLEMLYDASGAEASYRTALSLCQREVSECAWPLMQLGFLSTRHKSPEEAESYFRRAVTLRPDWAKPHFYLGKTLASRGDLAGARAEMEIALQIDSVRPEYHYQIARVFQRLGETRKFELHMAQYNTIAGSHGGGESPEELSPR